jgi:hypothetical protein
MMKLVYIAHPLSGDGSREWGDCARNLERTIRFIAYAMHEGNAVISWVHHELTWRRRLTPDSAHFYLDRDLVLLSRADELWLAGPVEVSRGMQLERDHAVRLGIAIRQEPAWLDPLFSPVLPCNPIETPPTYEVNRA